MVYGAFAFLDILGFKGIWKRYPQVQPDQIIEFLAKAKDAYSRSPLFGFLAEGLPTVKQDTVFISDTVAISTYFATEPAKKDLAYGYAVYLTVQTC